jgi:hypothetical protein
LESEYHPCDNKDSPDATRSQDCQVFCHVFDAAFTTSEPHSNTVTELRVRVDIVNRVLAEFVDRTAPADLALAGHLRVALEHGQAIAETIGAPGED